MINFFKYESRFYPFRWFIVACLIIALFLSWHNLNGGRIFNRSNQQEWSSSGPGYHK